ncbi:IS1634 family transposase [Streptomyces sp. KMM 9044]|uniref:IS1634 family transposase n=1 Tax=Streptomyces sp. KMM 9044 TaxID=2744474 RepID=UPI003FA7DC62
MARKAGVSEATVSRVLDGKPGVSESTRQAVLSALDVLGYERPTQLRGERARLVGLVLSELQNPIFPAFAGVIGGALAQPGLTPVLCTQTRGGVSEADYATLLLQQQLTPVLCTQTRGGVSEADYATLLLQQQASGVVFAGGLYARADVPHGHYRQLAERNIPVVLVNAAIEHLGFPGVSCDDAVAVEQAWRHLASLGHERIGLVLGPADHVPSARKLAAVRAVAGEVPDEHIAGTVGARAIGEFGIDVSRPHWDMTGMSVHGAYPVEGQDEDFPVINHGHPEDRRVDLKQVQAGLAGTADGGIPLHARVFDGPAAEVSQGVGAMKDLRTMAGTRGFLMAADSKLVSCADLTALLASGVHFIAPAPAAQVKDHVCAALDLDRATAVDWTPGRDTGKPPERREKYRVLEDTRTLMGPRKREPELTVRRILIHSTANAADQRTARDKRLAKAAEDPNKLAQAAVDLLDTDIGQTRWPPT